MWSSRSNRYLDRQLLDTIMFRFILRSWLAGLRRRWRRRLDSEPTALDTIEETATISDCVDTELLTQQCPAQWCATVEIVQFRGEPLTEVVRLTDSESYRITLKPVELCTPTGQIELYTRTSPQHSRRHRRTVESLSVAVTAATEIAATRQAQRQRSVDLSANRPSKRPTNRSTEASTVDL